MPPACWTAAARLSAMGASSSTIRIFRPLSGVSEGGGSIDIRTITPSPGRRFLATLVAGFRCPGPQEQEPADETSCACCPRSRRPWRVQRQGREDRATAERFGAGLECSIGNDHIQDLLALLI